ncbi:nuclear transport factor 2 family protein [Candidatus Woesearchaeota archaeon]|nr:nuclear transport factor 2 family protein [Candidatus Woesearchaeota archaeon]
MAGNKPFAALLVLLAVLLVLLAAGCGQQAESSSQQEKEQAQAQEQAQPYEAHAYVAPQNPGSLQPKEVVEAYYSAFASRDYKTMYAVISDGFKRIEPTAKDYASFEQEMSRFYETASAIRLVSVGSPQIDADTATVGYKLEVVLLSGAVKPFDSAFTLRKRSNGWKLIHPYGQNIDAG